MQAVAIHSGAASSATPQSCVARPANQTLDILALIIISSSNGSLIIKLDKRNSA